MVGLGPGSLDDLTPRARKAIEEADIVVGYVTYLKLIEELLVQKETYGTGMMGEVQRCQAAVDMAAAGKRIAVVSSGDSGIYGMAGLVWELALKLPEEKRPQVEVIAGISAVQASAAVLGAPLMHDFAVISLSDLLTPWPLIMKRVQLAGEGDFVMALYNPKSKKRVTQIEEVQQCLLKTRKPETPVGIVRQASRTGEKAIISDLAHFTEEEIDMFSLVIIGNSQTYTQEGRMITPRGYEV